MWKTIKNLLQKDGGKCIIVEDEKPAYIVMKIEDYENLTNSHQPLVSTGSREKVNLSEVNNEILEQKELTDKEEKEANKDLIDDGMNNNGNVKIEDLPF